MSIVSEEKSWLEWVVFALSSLLIIAMVVYLVNDAFHDAGRPPDIRVTLGTPKAGAQGYMVPVSVANAGDQTATGLEVEVFGDGASEERARLSFDYLASGEIREGWVGFSKAPTGHLRGRIVGYSAQ